MTESWNNSLSPSQSIVDHVMVTQIRLKCFHMSMHGCGAEGADKHCGKVWQTCAINIAKTKFEAARHLKKVCELLE